MKDDLLIAAFLMLHFYVSLFLCDFFTRFFRIT